MRQTYVSIILFALAGCAGNQTSGATDKLSQSTGATCGSATCAAGTECCNASCGICVQPGGACIQEQCDAPSPPPSGALCADRKGGALITLGNAPGTLDGPDQIVLWITDAAFIDEAIQHQANGDWRVAIFDQVIAGSDCDATHAWHVDPAKAAWQDTATEVCDGTVTYVTANLSTWGANWCPWDGAVIAVDDRR